MVRLDGEAAWSETTVATAGPWALTLITVVPELGVRFISAYVGGERIATGATHALTHPGGGELAQREHTREALPVTHARERCPLDHGAELQRALVCDDGDARCGRRARGRGGAGGRTVLTAPYPSRGAPGPGGSRRGGRQATPQSWQIAWSSAAPAW